MKLKIKKIVTKKLIEESNKKQHLFESFNKIIGYKDEEFVKELVITSVRLMNEGYTMDEIANYINEDNNPLSTAASSLGLGNVNFGNLLKGGLKSTLKEYIINYLLKNVLNVDPEWARYMAIGFADFDVRDILLPFKDIQNCNNYMPKIVDQVLEIIVRDVGSKVFETEKTGYGISNLPSNVTGNVIGQSIKDSNVSENLSKNYVCKYIHSGQETTPQSQTKPVDKKETEPKSI